MKNTNVVLGVIAGVAVGALVGVLLAPDKGSATRRKIINLGADLTEDMKGKLGDMVAMVQEKYGTTMKDAKTAVKDFVMDKV